MVVASMSVAICVCFAFLNLFYDVLSGKAVVVIGFSTVFDFVDRAVIGQPGQLAFFFFRHSGIACSSLFSS